MTLEHPSATTPLAVRPDPKFLREVVERSGVNLNLCWDCRTCAGGCPFYEAMDFGPQRLIRLIQLGLWKEVLESRAIWLCVGCHTCAVQCPNAIDVAALNDTLRDMALERGVTVAEPGVLAFHESVLSTIERYGRTHKLEVMVRYKLRNRDFFTDTGIGFKMLTKGKLDLLPSRSRAIEQIRQLFRHKAAA